MLYISAIYPASLICVYYMEKLALCLYTNIQNLHVSDPIPMEKL